MAGLGKSSTARRLARGRSRTVICGWRLLLSCGLLSGLYVGPSFLSFRPCTTLSCSSHRDLRSDIFALDEEEGSADCQVELQKTC